MIGIWPLIMGVTMFVQMRLNPTPPDPTQKMIFTWMPVIFTFMLATFPAGLVIYWAWNNTLSVTQQYMIMRRQGVEVDLIGNIRDTFRRTPATARPARQRRACGTRSRSRPRTTTMTRTRRRTPTAEEARKKSPPKKTPPKPRKASGRPRDASA